MPAAADFIAEHDRFLKHLQITVEEASPDFARVSVPLSEHHRNGWGAAHGGLICSLADAAFGAAANYGSKYAVVTLSTSMDFIRPGFPGPLKAEATAIHRGSRILNYSVKIFDGNNTLIAQGLLSGCITSKALPE